jgi:DNA-directed RNA polymerase subunit beta
LDVRVLKDNGEEVDLGEEVDVSDSTVAKELIGNESVAGDLESQGFSGIDEDNELVSLGSTGTSGGYDSDDIDD